MSHSRKPRRNIRYSAPNASAGTADTESATVEKMGVEHRAVTSVCPRQLSQGPDVVPRLQQVRRKRVPQCGSSRSCNTRTRSNFTGTASCAIVDTIIM